MADKLTKTDELKTISIEKDTWILEVPAEICQKEGFAEGTLVSLTLKTAEFNLLIFIRRKNLKNWLRDSSENMVNL